MFHFNGLPGVMTIEKENKGSSKNKKKLELEVIVGNIDANAKYRKVIQAGIARWIKDFQEGRIQFKSVDDLKKLIEMDMVLQKEDIVNSRRRARLDEKNKTEPLDSFLMENHEIVM